MMLFNCKYKCWRGTRYSLASLSTDRVPLPTSNYAWCWRFLVWRQNNNSVLRDLGIPAFESSVFAGVQLWDGGRGGGGGGRRGGGSHQDAHHEGTVDYNTLACITSLYPRCLSRIPDPRRGEKFCLSFFVATNFYRIENYYIFQQVPYRMKFEPIDQEL